MRSMLNNLKNLSNFKKIIILIFLIGLEFTLNRIVRKISLKDTKKNTHLPKERIIFAFIRMFLSFSTILFPFILKLSDLFIFNIIFGVIIFILQLTNKFTLNELINIEKKNNLSLKNLILTEMRMKV